MLLIDSEGVLYLLGVVQGTWYLDEASSSAALFMFRWTRHYTEKRVTMGM